MAIKTENTFNIIDKINYDEIINKIFLLKNQYSIYKQDNDFLHYFYKNNIFNITVFITEQKELTLDQDNNYPFIELNFNLNKKNIVQDLLDENITQELFIKKIKIKIEKEWKKNIFNLKSILIKDKLDCEYILKNKYCLYFLSKTEIILFLNEVDLSKYRQRIFNNKYDIETNNFILKCINKLNIEKGLLYNTDLSIIYDDLDKNTFDLQQLKYFSITDDIQNLFFKQKDVFLKQIDKYEININNITTDFFLIIGLYFELFTEEEINKLSKNKKIINHIKNYSNYLFEIKDNNLSLLKTDYGMFYENYKSLWYAINNKYYIKNKYKYLLFLSDQIKKHKCTYLNINNCKDCEKENLKILIKQDLIKYSELLSKLNNIDLQYFIDYCNERIF